MLQQRIEVAIDGCYDAVFAPGDWPDALHELARAANAVCCGFYPRDSCEIRLRLPSSRDYRDFLEEFLRDGWWRHDHRAERGWPMADAGRQVLIEHDVASDDDRKSLAQYHELYPRYDVPWWGAVFFRLQGRLWGVPFLRSRSQGAFGREDAEGLSQLIPHLRRMVRFAAEASASHARTALDILERMDSAAMLIDWRGSVLRLNKPAELMIGTHLFLSHGRLSAADRESDRRLQQMIGLAVASTRPSMLPKDPIVIARPGLRPLLVDAISATEVLSDTFLHARALLLISDLEKPMRPSDVRAMLAFGLTRSEARLAAVIASGVSPRQAAAQLGITEETARTTLKRVFAKAGVSRQSELSAVLMRAAMR